MSDEQKDIEEEAPTRPPKEDKRRRARLLAAAQKLDAPELEVKAREEDSILSRAKALSKANEDATVPPWRRGTHAPTRPWEILNAYRRDLLGVSQAPSRAGYVRRWIRIDMLEDRLAKGWQLADSSNYSMTTNVVGEESDVEPGLVRRRELVLCEMRKEWYDEIQAAKLAAHKQQLGKVESDLQATSQQTGIPRYDPRGQ